MTTNKSKVMHSDIFHKLSSWFDTYTASFKNGDSQLEDAVTLKYQHTRRVGDEMEALCRSMHLDALISELALIAALFHDVARYEQFRKYRTFSDHKSENHAVMGVEIINEHDVFDELESGARETVIEAIRYHNAVEVPGNLSEEQSLICRLLRDADKLDIYKIALDHYVNPDPLRNETVQVGIPDGDSVNPEVCKYVLSRKIVPYDKIRTVNDFKMIQLGWVFDLNFRHSFVCVKERNYIAGIRKFLPATPDVDAAVAAVEKYLEERIRQ